MYAFAAGKRPRSLFTGEKHTSTPRGYRFSDMYLPKDVKNIINRLKDAGYDAYAVGGCVRDTLMGRIPADWDITTDALPNEVKGVFDKTVDTGLKHGTVTVIMDGVGYEVTTYRVDGDYSDARHPDEVTFTRSLKEDLKRRDFTINAMAYNDEEGLVDLYGGRRDMERGLIRAVGDPSQRFTEDALRMMRAIRFSAQLGFEIEESTAASIDPIAGNLAKISAERIRTELEKTIVSDHPEKIREFYNHGLSRHFLPEFDVMMETDQKNPHHCYTVGEHTIKALTEIENDRILRLSILFHDIGKPECITMDEDGINHFKNHQMVGADMTRRILRRLKYDNDTIRRVTDMVLWHDARPGDSIKSVRRLMSKSTESCYPGIFSIMRADIMAQSMFRRKEKLAALEKYKENYHRILEERQCVSVRDLAVDGKDLIKQGISSGPRIGEILGELLEIVVEDPEKNTKDILMDYVNQILSGDD